MLTGIRYMLSQALARALAGDDELPMLSSLHTTPPLVDFPTFYGELRATYTIRLITFAAATIFGALHCIAWSFQFPSVAGQYLWRISALLVTFAPLPLLLILGFCAIDRIQGRWWANAFMYIFIAPWCFIGALLYLPARCILLVLCLIELRHLPPKAHQTVEWAEFVPHL